MLDKIKAAVAQALQGEPEREQARHRRALRRKFRILKARRNKQRAQAISKIRRKTGWHPKKGQAWNPSRH